MKTQEFPYSPSLFDADYYGGAARGGFPAGYSWDNHEQQLQLEKKFLIVQKFGDFRSILFVGCAMGFEVRYFYEWGKETWGVDVSRYAIENCNPAVKDRVFLYQGHSLGRFKDHNFDVVAAFDVLTLLPDVMLEQLAPEMMRVCAKRIIFRTVVRSHRDGNDPWHGNDGVTYRYLRWEDWVRLFEQRQFRLVHSESDRRCETIFVFERKA